MKTKTNNKKQMQGLQVRPVQSQAAPKSNTSRWHAVFFHGPEPTRNRHGDEIPTWHVFVGDEDSKPLSRVYVCHNFTRAQDLAHAMQRDRRLELVAEANPADGRDLSTTRADTEQHPTVNDYQ